MLKLYQKKKANMEDYAISIFKGGNIPKYNSFSKPIEEKDLSSRPSKRIGKLINRVENMHLL